MDSLIETIMTQVTETEDEFIFQTLSDYATKHYKIVVKKEELVRAIQLIRMSREYGPSIGERWATATQNAAELGRAYRKGLQDGIQKARNRLENTFKEETKND